MIELEKMPPVGFMRRDGPSDFSIRSDTAPGGWVTVSNSEQEGWICDCMWWTIHMKHFPPHNDCKHIRQVKETFIKG